jgi:hypothetical protein
MGMKSPFKISDKLKGNHIHEELLTYLSIKLDNFYELNKEIIEDYLYMKSKLEEFSSRINLQYRLTVSNSAHSGKVINAKVKLPFAKKENSKSKYPFFNVHIGKLVDYKLGLKDPQLIIDAENKLREFIDKKYPFSILNADNQIVEFKY